MGSVPRITKEFLGKEWKDRTVQQILTQLKQTESADKKKSPGLLISVTSERNVEHVKELILSQEDQPIAPTILKARSHAASATLRAWLSEPLIDSTHCFKVGIIFKVAVVSM